MRRLVDDTKEMPRHKSGSPKTQDEWRISLSRWFSVERRCLFVASRQRRELYDLLVERFQGDGKVEVVMDRRGERQGAPAMTG
jgi:hypothetical protein